MKNLILTLIIASLVITSACTCSTCGKQNELPDIPTNIKIAAANFIISKTGKDFFDNYIFADLLQSKKNGNLYEMHYTFRMIDNDFVNEPIVLFVDTLGNINTKYEVKGIPNCIDNEEECTFNIDRDKAFAIAKQNNFTEGIREWDASFRWHSKLNKYVWHIISTEKEIGNPDSDTYKADGEEIVIDPYDGKILTQREWIIN